jgi:hypothetical protein
MSDGNAQAILDYSVASLYPSNWRWAVRDFLTQPAGAWRFFIPAPGSVEAWKELLKRAEIYVLVSQVPRLIGVPSSPPFPLLELVERAYALGQFPAVWAVEGLGKAYGDSSWEQGEVPRDLLTGPQAAQLPAASLLMMHAGIGLSIATRLLSPFAPLAAAAPRQDLARALAEIVALCRQNSRPGYAGAAFESIGLVTRTFHPGLVQDAGRLLAEADEAVAGFYWHGVGRAIFFLAISFLPCGNADRRGFEMAASEAPDQGARDSAVAGMAWAVTLTNQQQPEVVADLLRRDRALAGDPAFVNGLASSIIMRYDTTPDAPFIASFCDYRPPGAAAAELWEEAVAGPCRRALDEYYPVLKATDRLGEVFRYQPLPQLIQQRRSGAGGWGRRSKRGGGR